MTVDPLIIGAYLLALVVVYFAGFHIGVCVKFINDMGKGG